MIAGWYHDHLIANNRSPSLWMLIGFVVTFGVTRGITVMIRRRKLSGADESEAAVKDVIIGGVHIHHQVWGIMLLLVMGIIEFRFRPDHPWVEVLAALFGVGAALTLDEFALWLHLDDVYWSEEGKKSIDAVMIAAVVLFAFLMNSSPGGVSSKDASRLGAWFVFAVLVVHACVTLICLLKGKLATGLLGLVIPILGTVGAIRIAKPDSFWARRYYGERKPAKQAKAEERFAEGRHTRQEKLREMFTPGAEPAKTAPHDDHVADPH